MLYVFAKFKWRSKHGDDYIKAGLDVLLKEPKLTSYTAARNLWNLFAIDYFDKPAMERFSQVLIDSEPSKLHDLDIANAVRSFAHFQYIDYDCLEVII